MAIQLQPQERDPVRFNQAIRELVEGRHNAASTFMLTPNATTTTVSHPNCSRDSQPQFAPHTANAAAEVGNGTIWISSIDQGSFTVRHANNAQSDRVFGFCCSGG
jgi:hypothetical protein